MKKGFTLIELLIVTVVIVALMGIVFRLTGIAGSSSKRETTVSRMQRLENCLSGYYAVFGSYPPVPLQGVSRDIFRKSSNGVQSTDSKNELSWENVKVACLAQPVRVQFPYAADMFARAEDFQRGVNQAYNDDIYDDDTKKSVDAWREASMIDLYDNPGAVNSFGVDLKQETSFNRLPLFRFGLMSFLLPRYRFMLDCKKDAKGKFSSSKGLNIDECLQWTENNPLPPNMGTGIAYESWEKFCEAFGEDNDWQVDLIPSQAACARWLPNLIATSDDKHLVTGHKINVFGSYIGDGYVIPSIAYPTSFRLNAPGGYKEGGASRGFPLLFITVKDGWSNDFYYYSPAPYQTYVLWSSGENEKTIPPWVDVTQLDMDDYKTAIKWMSDDIKFMSTGK